jgi:hypothetical protein
MPFNVGDKVTWNEYDPQGASYGHGLIPRDGTIDAIIPQEPLYQVGYFIKSESSLRLQSGGRRNRKTRRMNRK